MDEILVNGQQCIYITLLNIQIIRSDNGLKADLLRPNRHWKDEWGGETVIKLDGEWKKAIPTQSTCFPMQRQYSTCKYSGLQTIHGLKAYVLPCISKLCVVIHLQVRFKVEV